MRMKVSTQSTPGGTVWRVIDFNGLWLNEGKAQGTEVTAWLPLPGGGMNGRLGPGQLVQVWDSLRPEQGRSQKPGWKFL